MCENNNYFKRQTSTQQQWEISYRSIFSSWSMKKTVKWTEWEEGNILNLLSSIVDDAEKNSPALLCGLILAQIVFLDITTWASGTCNVRVCVCVWGHEISEVRPQLCDGSNFVKVQQQRRPPLNLRYQSRAEPTAVCNSFILIFITLSFDISQTKCAFKFFTKKISHQGQDFTKSQREQKLLEWPNKRE